LVAAVARMIAPSLHWHVGASGTGDQSAHSKPP